MENNIKITFWINRTKKNSKNLVPVYLRVAHNYDHFTRATGIRIPAADWDKKAMRIRGATQEAITANATLDSLKVKVLQIVNQLNVGGKPYNIHTIQKTLDGNEISQLTVLKIYEEQLGEMKKLKGKDFAPATIIKYTNTHLRLRQYMKFKYHRSDMFLYELNYQFMKDFESFLKQKYDNSGVTVYKHYQRTTRVIHQAMHRGLLDKNPFDGYKIKLPRKKIQYLTQEEIDRLEATNFQVERLNVIRDVFIFAVYTGLAYSECESLSPDNITVGMDKEPWLNIHRKKTGREYQIPLLPKALVILNKYKNHPLCIKKNRCLPVPSNVKYNAYLKEIADIAGIPKSKPLVTHLARKTFASTIALCNGMNIGVVSKILGHNSIKVTLDSYGAIIDELMIRSVKDLKDKLTPTPEPETPSGVESDKSTDPHSDLISQINQKNWN
jgi:integrase